MRATKTGGNLPRVSYKDQELADAVRAEISLCEDTELSANREQALKYYNADPRGDEVEGRSRVISTDTSDAIGAILAQLLPMISSDAVVEFEPNDEADVEAARAESMAVNKVMLEENNGTMELEQSVQDALLLRNGVLKVWYEDDVTINRLDVALYDDSEIVALLNNAAPNDVRTYDEESATIKSVVTDRRFRFGSIDITQFMYRANWHSYDLDKCPFVAERQYITRSDLVRMGVSKEVAFSLPATTEDTQGDNYRRNRSAQSGLASSSRDQDTIECHESYILYDWDGDGISERMRVLLGAGNYPIEIEEVDVVPYAVGTCILAPHRLTGRSVFDAVCQIQDGKTAALRQWIDNLTICNNTRLIMNDAETNLADALDSKPGGVVRSRNPGNVVPVPVVDTGSSNLQLLGYLNEMRTEGIGASLEMQNGMMQLQNVAAAAQERQYTSKELMVALFAKNFGDTLIRRAWRLMHNLLQKWSNKPLWMQISGQWVEVDPSSWSPRDRLNVKAGLTVGQRAHAQNALSQSIQLQVAAMNQGLAGVLADATTIYRTYTDLLAMAGIENPQVYAIDPSSPAAQQAAQQAQQAAQQAQQAAQALQSAQIQLADKQITTQAQGKKDDVDFKYWNAALQAEVEQAKLVGSATLELERIQAEGALRAREKQFDFASRVAEIRLADRAEEEPDLEEAS